VRGATTAHCHPERSEGSWFLRLWAAQAETKIPRCARDDKLLLDDKRALVSGLA
jgi:hypothetical protein